MGTNAGMMAGAGAVGGMGAMAAMQSNPMDFAKGYMPNQAQETPAEQDGGMLGQFGGMIPGA